jgi:hypothetical protein
MNKAQVIEQIQKEFPDLNLERQVAGRDHDAYEMLEIPGAARQGRRPRRVNTQGQSKPQLQRSRYFRSLSAKFGPTATEDITKFKPGEALRVDTLTRAPRRDQMSP